MGIKDRRTKILLALILLSDVDLKAVNVDERVQKVFDISFNQKTRGTLSGMAKEGLIEKQNEGQVREQGSAYKLTEKGFTSLSLQFPFFRYLREKWDGKWRIISYEIPESKRELRDKLRREMQGWGLGPWHRSFWLTPHPIIETLRQLVSQKEEEKYIQAFEADHTFGEREVLIEKVWGKSNLDKKYRELFKSWHDLLSKEGDKVDKFKTVASSYVEMLKIDPGLPSELVGEKWIAFEAFNIFKEIRSILLT
ncbi:MAG: PaaX family transcriptional regulator C-terminal domain-containing protein [bacterium]|nr:PaaX family transcriptional regulator C-terminal domain-containing protein [bacterium]